MFKLLNKTPIRTKFVGIFVFILLLISIFISTYYPQQQRKNALDTLNNKVTSMAEMIAIGVAIGLESDDFAAVAEAVNWAKSDSSLSYVILLDTTLNEFAQFNPNDLNININNFPYEDNVFEGVGIFHAITLIRFQSHYYGTLLLGYSLENLNKTIRDNRITTLFISITILTLGFLIALLFSNMITKPLVQLQEMANKIASGNHDVQIEVKTGDELGVLGHAFNHMISSIKKSITEKDEENWRRRGRAELDEMTRGEHPVQVLSTTILNFLMSYTNAIVGALYLTDDNYDLELMAGFALAEPKSNSTKFKMGEGLIGQCASQKQSLSILSPDISINKSVAPDCFPNQLLVVPFLFESSVIGVIELGSLNKFTERQNDFLEQTLDSIAIIFNTAQSRSRMSALLAATSKQAKELTRQKEEVGEKNKALKKAHSEIEEKAAELEKTSKFKSDFLANMSHEIRTPLNAVIGMTELCLGTELTAEQNDFLNVIKGSSESLLSVINDILDISKIEAGKVLIENVAFNIYDVLDSVTEILSLRAQEKNLELTCFIDPSIQSMLLGDPTRLRQVVINLAGNAIKFTSKGEISINIEPVSQNDNETELMFSIIDTGLGIAPNMLDKIFHSFSQEDDSTTRKFGGTGLGLSISKSLVELMQGEIGVESELKKGTTFYFKLPFQISKLTAERNENQNETNILENVSVLILEGNATNRNILEQTLIYMGCKVYAARDYDEAQSKFQHLYKDIDLVILDYKIPKVDGIEFADLIRAEPGFKNVKLLMLSSWKGVDEDVKKKLNISDIIVKPIKQSQLQGIIMRLFAHDEESRKIRSSKTSEMQKPAMPGETTSQIIRRILLVDDVPENIKIASMFLKKAGYKVVDIAENGRIAFEAIQKEKYDLVFMDIQMPELDGFQATAKIREWEKQTGKAPVPIIALTAHALKGYRDKCLKAGMDDYLTKPINKKILLETTEKWLNSIQVLVVDDSEDNQTLVSNFLRKSGEFRITSAYNGKEALDILKTRNFSIVLLDMEMPVMNGYEAALEIRKLENRLDIPVIAMTSHYGHEEIKKCIDAGCSDYLAKPIRKENLHKMIKTAMNAKEVTVVQVEGEAAVPA